MICPKCGHQQEEFFAECARCAIIFSKVAKRKARHQPSKQRFQKRFNGEIEKIAANDLQTTKPPATNRDCVTKTLKIMAVILLPLIVIALLAWYPNYACKKSPGCTMWGEFRIEYFGLTYEQFQNAKHAPKMNIPESSENIDFFRFALRDCGNTALQARVEERFLDLYAIASDYPLHDVAHPILVKNAPSTTETMSLVLGGCGDPRPAWLQADESMTGFNTNVLKYGYGGSRGKGIWAFYNAKTQTLRIFSFQGQHIGVGELQRALNSPDSNMSDGLQSYHRKPSG